jgi:hypothetical protein
VNGPPLECLDDRRRHEVRRRDHNGIDYLEVSDDQRRLHVYFLGPAPPGLTRDNVRITGGRRVRDVAVLDVAVRPAADPELDTCMEVTLDKPGDFSTYTLCLVDLPGDARFDPRYRCIDFTFKASCPSDLDCKTPTVCPPEVHPQPEIDYLAKDYGSFRRLVLDRLAVVMPQWTDRHVPDIGITLVELLAYVGDYLSYHQDAVATEAYLDTARQRISVRRHARLVDYAMHEGCNARTWIHINTSTDITLPARELSFVTGFPNAPRPTGRLLTWDDLRTVSAGLFEVFEPLLEAPDADVSLWLAHNEIGLYTWGDAQCCLPRGATSATLVDGPQPPPDTGKEQTETDQTPPEQTGTHAPPCPPTPQRALHLAPGDVLILQELIGPKTGDSDDADPAHRHAVRLTRVDETVDPLNGAPLLEVSWSDADALPFPLCLSVIGKAPDCELIEDISVARGNVLLADHGRTLAEPENLGCVPIDTTQATCEAQGRPAEVVRRPGRYRPTLDHQPLTFSQPLSPGAPAARLLDQDPREAGPSISLTSRDGDATATWTARPHLLASGPDDPHFVVEMDDRQRAHLRFGDGALGRQPGAGHRFDADYRTGTGPVGNVGAGTIVLAVSDSPRSGATLTPTNPLPARGGTAPEPASDVKLFAPHAFRQVLERAITADDYAELAGRHPGVQRAAAELRFNGSWFEVRVAIDPLRRAEADDPLLAEIAAYLEAYRRIGHDVAVRTAHYVPVDLELDVCVAPGVLRGHVKAALLDRFSTRLLPDGTRGFFHPDELTFGQGVAVSRLIAAAHAVPGVAGVSVTKLQRLFERPNGELERGVLVIGPLEIARLDNDPNFPENGRIHITLRGGR